MTPSVVMFTFSFWMAWYIQKTASAAWMHCAFIICSFSESDGATAFFNSDEYAEDVNVDGATVTALLIESKGEIDGRPGVNREALELHVKAADIPTPQANQKMAINGKKYKVRVIEPTADVLTLYLDRSTS